MKFSMIVLITSLDVARHAQGRGERGPERARDAPAASASSSGSGHGSAAVALPHAVAASAPTSSWPSAPMFQMPAPEGDRDGEAGEQQAGSS